MFLKLAYIQVDALTKWIIGIYLHSSLTMNETAEYGIENFVFTVREQVQVNPDNLRAMSPLKFLLFELNTLQRKIVKLWVSRSHAIIGVMTVLCWIYTTAITPRKWRQGCCFVTTKCHVIQINQSENRNSYSVRKLNKKVFYLPWLIALIIPKSVSTNMKRTDGASNVAKVELTTWNDIGQRLRMVTDRQNIWKSFLLTNFFFHLGY